MSYATDTEYRAALVAYRALHAVFYRFHKTVCADQHAADSGERQVGTTDSISTTEHEYGELVGALLPSLEKVYAGPPQYIDRLAATLRELGMKHAAASTEPFDPLLTRQAYIDVDNILQDLLREREHYPAVFDEAFAEPETPNS